MMPLIQGLRLRYWLPAVFWCGFIFIMSTAFFSAENTALVIDPVLRFLIPGISAPHVEALHGLIRKSAHVTEYFILGIFFFRAIHLGSRDKKALRSAFFAAAAVVLYAATDEFHQLFVPSRGASVIDVGIDSSGGILAQIASLLWHWRKPA